MVEVAGVYWLTQAIGEDEVVVLPKIAQRQPLFVLHQPVGFEGSYGDLVER
jgi:hypothetical protein